MAKKKTKAKKKKVSKRKTSTSGVKPIKSTMTKRELISHLADAVDGGEGSKETRQTVSKTLDALGDTISRSIAPGGAGTFMMPRLFKVTLKTRRAIKKGTMVRSPATGGMVPSKGRPESQSVKIRPLANLKKAAAGDL